MKIAIIEFPGTNCERESAAAIRRAGMEPLHFRWNRDPCELSVCDGFLIAGGFSYEDRSRSGIIAALDPLMPFLQREADRGKPLIGICNGAQILVETGLVPDLARLRPSVEAAVVSLPGKPSENPEEDRLEEYRELPTQAALAANRRTRGGSVIGTGFYNGWVSLALNRAPAGCAFTSDLVPGVPLRIPAAHAEGRFVIPEAALQEMNRLGLTLFRYTDAEGYPDPDFPVNPNGSMENLAGICNPAGNVLALMPHPERTPDGDPIFTSMRRYLENRRNGEEIRLAAGRAPRESAAVGDRDGQVPAETSGTTPDAASAQGRAEASGIGHNPGPVYRCPPEARELIVELIITDNTAVSVENALRRRNIPTVIRRHAHWEITFRPGLSREAVDRAMEKIRASGELFNTNKEFTCASDNLSGRSAEDLSRTLLIRDPEGEDTIGEHKTHALRSWFGIDELAAIRSGILWTIVPDPVREPDNAPVARDPSLSPASAAELCEAAEATRIFCNPIAARRYLYERIAHV